MTVTKSRTLMIAALVVGAAIAVPLAVPATGRCPEGMARVDQGGFCIDRWEASLVEQLPDGSERPHSPFHSPGRSASVRAVSRPGVVPQGYISALQAQRACQSSGRRLCRDTEWLAACRGPQQRQFPYGNARQAGRCNENHTRHPVVQLFGAERRMIWDGVRMNDPQLNQLAGTLALTGAFEGCHNESGVYDMVGNLHEWTASPEGTFRGGYYMDTHMNGEGCSYATRAHDVAYHDYSTGFRCCANIPGDT